MRILWLAPEPPAPPLTGGRERARKMIDYLSCRHEVHLLTLADAADQPGLDDLARALDGMTVVPYQARSRDNAGALRARLNDLISAWRPDCIHAQGLGAWPGPPWARGCTLDLHDVPTLLWDQLQALRRRRLAGWRSRLQGLRLRRLERGAVGAARAIIVTSQADARALERHKPSLPRLSILPNGVDAGYWQLPAIEPQQPTVLFPGALNWPPNIDAARTLVTELLPLIQTRTPSVRIIIAGRRPDPILKQLADEKPNVALLADPADMRPIFARATLIAVPLRAATGTRLKILQALAGGRAVVSTPVGAAGLDLVPGRHLLVERLVEPFAAAVVLLLRDHVARQQLIVAGQEAVERSRWERFLPLLDAVYPPQGNDR